MSQIHQEAREIIPVFFAVDDAYSPCLGVTLRSLIDHASAQYEYRIYILVTYISEENRKRLSEMATENVSLSFVSVNEKLDSLCGELHTRDYYSKTTYYRLFIPAMFPEYEKGLYLDCDLLIRRDVAELYHTELGDKLLGAGPEEVMQRIKIFGDYVEAVVNVPVEEYFNAGILVLNMKALREMNIERVFEKRLGEITYRVTQDEDYLNDICRGRVLMLDNAWNKNTFGGEEDDPSVCIAHFKMNWKPWQNDGIPFAREFWECPERTAFYQELRQMKDGRTEADARRDREAYEALERLAVNETATARAKKAPTPPLSVDRLAILKRIEEYERHGWFDRDVEDDPPTRPLRPGEVDYTAKKLSTRIASEIANFVGKSHFDRCIRRGELVIREVRGMENYLAVEQDGVLITCNHFNPFDNYAVFKVIEKRLGRRRLHKIIREGNYTSFPGLYGYLFRHCNTIPIASDHTVLKEMLEGVQTLFARGEKILIYPEQGMWWNYKKPRPLKTGAFRFAAKSLVPVLPFFITMEDTDKLDGTGYPIQAYTVHILPAIHPDPALSVRENSRRMCEQNYLAWRAVYEEVYGIPLTYTTEGEVAPCSL